MTLFADIRLGLTPRALRLAAPALSLFLTLLLPGTTPASTPVDAGYRDFDYGSTVNTTPTGEKPESKLWWTDGAWWGVLWSPAANAYAIQRFDLATQGWTSVGPVVDARSGAKVDVLWDETRLYVLSHIFTLNPGPAGGAGNSGRLYRYSFDSAADAYSLDPGFPVTVNSSKSETLVLDKDSTGKLWVTWVEGGRIKVNRSTTSDGAWGTPFDLPVQGANVDPDDMSSLVSFGGNKIGVMWSNQVDRKIYFATHLDGIGDTSWLPREEALGGVLPGQMADDHIHLKASCTDGAVYAVTKTSLVDSDPLVYLLKRSSVGAWSRHTVSLATDNHTRPILALDAEGNRAYVFAMSDKTGRYIIYVKSASLADLAFPNGLGTPFIDSPGDPKANNPTSTKRCVHGASGILVMGSDQDTHYYLHNYLGLGGRVLPPAISAFNPASGPVGTVVTVNGTGFANASAVRFNGAAASFTVESATRLRATVPSGATSGPISVTNPAGTATSSASFGVVAPPTITSFNPSGGVPGVTVVTVNGSGFATASAVRFNGTAADFTVESAARLRATVPIGATSGPISVTNPAGTATSAKTFTVLVGTSAGPSIDSFDPDSGLAGTLVTVNGSGLSSTTELRFNGTAAGFSVESDTRLRATVPTGATSGPISVTTPQGSATSDADFTVPRTPGLRGVGPLVFAVSSFPNPFGDRTSIRFELPRAGPAKLTVYDLFGRLVTTLADGVQAPGRYEVSWDARDGDGATVPSGVYLLRFEAEGFGATRRLLRLR